MTNGKDPAEIYRLIADVGFSGVLNMHLDRISTAMLMADNKARYLGVKNGVSGLKAFIIAYLEEEDIKKYNAIIVEANAKKNGESRAQILNFRYQKYLDALELLMKCLDDLGVLFEWRKKQKIYKQGEEIEEKESVDSIVSD